MRDLDRLAALAKDAANFVEIRDAVPKLIAIARAAQALVTIAEQQGVVAAPLLAALRAALDALDAD